MEKQLRTLLAIDDEPVILDAIQRVCSAEGWHVDTVTGATEGLELARKKSYDLCLCDIMLPDMDGFQFLEKLHESGIDLAVIMTTGFATIENAVKSLDMGAIDYLPKPFTADEVLSALYRGFRYVDLKRRHEENTAQVDSIIVPCPTQYRHLGYQSWMHLDFDGSVKVGATYLFLAVIGSVKSIKLQPLEAEIIQGFSCAEFEAEDELIHQLMAPISGQIIRINEQLKDEPSILEKDPYFEGWLYVVVPKDLNYELKYVSGCHNIFA
jgi:CheY-like chemotaxis protein